LGFKNGERKKNNPSDHFIPLGREEKRAAFESDQGEISL